MTKLIYALWGDVREPAAISERLRDSEATRVQVNAAGDPSLAGAMALTTFATPIDAIVSIWTDEPAGAITAALENTADRVVGWEVTERRPLEPPVVADGIAADAMANVAFLRRPETLDRTEWLRRWLDEHTPIAIETQATFGYIQNIVVRPVTDDVEHVDAIVEELFPIAAARDAHAFYGSGRDDAELTRRVTALIDSVVRIGAHQNIDVVPTLRYLYLVPGSPKRL